MHLNWRRLIEFLVRQCLQPFCELTQDQPEEPCQPRFKIIKRFWTCFTLRAQWNSVMSQCHNVTMSQSHYVTMSLCHYVTMSLCHYVTISQSHNLTISQSHNLTMSQCHNVTMSQCHNVIMP
jgi:hypothetical protein